jgi:hypothetical protein
VLCTIFHWLFSFREANNEWMTVVSGGFDRPENSGNGKKSWKSCSSTTGDEGMTEVGHGRCRHRANKDDESCILVE